MIWKEEKEKFGKEIVRALYDEGMIRTWYRDKPEGWTLISGIWSPLYIQLRPLSSYPKLLRLVGRIMGKMIRKEAPHINKIVGVAMAGIPIAVAITIHEGIPSCFTRKLEGVKTLEDFAQKIEEYGEHTLVEGEIENGDRLIVIDDLVTRFDSKLVAIEQIKLESKKQKVGDIQCKDVAVLFDREQGAKERANECGINLYSLIPFKSKGLYWLKDKMNSDEHRILIDYLENTEKYQDIEIQIELAKMPLD